VRSFYTGANTVRQDHFRATQFLAKWRSESVISLSNFTTEGLSNMVKQLIFAVVFAAIASATPTYTNSGSGAITCRSFNPPDPHVILTTFTESGPNISLSCLPPGPVEGFSLTASANNLVAQASIGEAAGGEVGSWDVSSSASDTLLATGGTGQTTVTFTLSVTSEAGDDNTANQVTASFGVNGSQDWNFVQYTFTGAFFKHTTLYSVPEQVTIGVPFTWSATVDSNGGGQFLAANYIALQVSWQGVEGVTIADVATPEPATAWTVNLIGLLMLIANALRQRHSPKHQ
jgi:hypothetical protein